MSARNSRGQSLRAWPVQKTGRQTPDVAALGQRQCLMLLPLPRGERTRVRVGDDHGHRTPGLGTAAGRSAPLPRRALDGPKLRPGLLLLGGGMEEVPCHDPSVGRTSETPDCITLVLVPGGKRPFSATGGNDDSPALRGGGGKGIVSFSLLRGDVLGRVRLGVHDL